MNDPTQQSPSSAPLRFRMVCGLVGLLGMAGFGLFLAFFGDATSATERADDMHVTIQYVATPCGAHVVGCFQARRPDRIEIKTGLTRDETDGAILHELAHVEQSREGKPLDECAADAQAREWGSKYRSYDCP